MEKNYQKSIYDLIEHDTKYDYFPKFIKNYLIKRDKMKLWEKFEKEMEGIISPTKIGHSKNIEFKF